MRAFLRIVLALCAATAACAYTPPIDEDRSELVGDGKFLFVMLRDGEPRCSYLRCRYTVSGMYPSDASTAPLWPVKEYRGSGGYLLAADGVHMVAFNHGAADSKGPQRPALVFYKSGVPMRTCDLTELVPEPEKLPPGVYPFGTSWVKAMDFDARRALVTIFTVPGRLAIYDATTGQVIFRRDQGTPPPAIAGRAHAEWVGDLTAGDVATRRKAAQALGGPGSAQSETVNALIAALADADATVRAASAASLEDGALGAKAAVPALTKLLTDADPAARAAACRALGRVRNGAQAVADVGRLALDPDKQVRLAAIGALATLEYHQNTGGLISALSSSDPDTRGLAAAHLARIGGFGESNVAPAIALQASADPALRFAAARMLGRTRGSATSAVPALRRALADADAEVRRAAIESLHDLGPEALAAVVDLRALAAGRLLDVDRCHLDLTLLRIAGKGLTARGWTSRDRCVPSGHMLDDDERVDLACRATDPARTAEFGERLLLLRRWISELRHSGSAVDAFESRLDAALDQYGRDPVRGAHDLDNLGHDLAGQQPKQPGR